MPRDKDVPPAIRVFTVCDESRYLIVKNVPALGCGVELSKLFGSYGEVEECKPMDAEDCEPFTDVYWVKFSLVNCARFAKRKLDESVFLGNRLQVSYAPQFENISDTKAKLEGRRKEVLGRIYSRKPEGASITQTLSVSNLRPRDYMMPDHASHGEGSFIGHVSSNQDYFSSPSMNETVKFVREKLDKIKSNSEHIEAGPTIKRARVDNRRRI